MPDEGMIAEVEQVEPGSGGEGEQQQQQSTEQQQQTESPYSSKVSREYSQWLKGLKDANPNDPNVAKFARMAKDAYSRQYALSQLDPKGLDGVRERYSILDSVIHNDPERGELKGAEAIAALQDSARAIEEIDQKISSGDVTALESFGPEMKAGIAKMAPAILDLARDMDHEAYSAAVLPHFVQALAGSPLVSNFNAMVDVLNEQMPNWLPDDKKQAWAEDRMKRIVGMAGNMGTWLNAQADKAGKLPQAGQQRTQDGKTVDKQAQREQEFNKREQEQHWTTAISPKLDQHAAVKFQELFRPFSKRLHLDGATTNALKGEFSRRVSAAAAKDKPYMDQIGRYRAQRNPDPATVVNFAKVQFDKHAKTVMDSLVNERYKSFLSGKARVAPLTPQGSGQRQTPVSPGVQVVSQKPAMADIDHKNTPLAWLHERKYRLTSGKVVQVRA
jgi:hypothetical protein